MRKAKEKANVIVRVLLPLDIDHQEVTVNMKKRCIKRRSPERHRPVSQREAAFGKERKVHEAVL